MSIFKLGSNWTVAVAFALGFLSLAVATEVAAQMHGSGQGGGMHGHGHGADGTGHDEVNMPGLRGENASPEESADLAILFRNFTTLSRDVTNLPNGVRTITRASDPAVLDALIRHVTVMITRVEEKDDPKIFIQSPTLDLVFARSERIVTEIDILEDGIVVTQTSDDPELVATLQTHAEEVSDMAERGMRAVHERMMHSSN